MLQLPQVTLVIVETRMAALVEPVLRRCLAGIEFGAVLSFQDGASAPCGVAGVQTRRVELDSVQAYSRFMLCELAAHLRTSHMLVVQWDGFVLNPQDWDPAFLGWDYIGARLWSGAARGCVGNGGFSLRSRRLLDVMATHPERAHHPEDICLSLTQRDWLEREQGIRFAPPEVADRFAWELGPEPVRQPFGFHGIYNLHRAWGPGELLPLIPLWPYSVMAGSAMRTLARALMLEGRFTEARAIVERRLALGVRDRRTQRLRLEYALRSRGLPLTV